MKGKMNEPIIGIDLGTTYSEAAVLEDGRPRVLADAQGRRLLPSVVGLDKQGRLLVGEAALNQYLLFPERTVKSVKRKMGLAEPVRLGDQTYSPQEISAMILRVLKQRAETWLGCPVRKAVITVPAFFNDAQRQATREAGEIACLEVVRLLNEPTAAALVYKRDLDQGRNVMVYDLGGGTFDVSLVRMQQGVVEVVASHGDNHLGGDDFDWELVEWFAERIEEQSGRDIRSDVGIVARLLRAAVAAKHALSNQPFVQVREEFLFEHRGRPFHFACELSRDEYEALISPYIDRTFDAVHTALQDARLSTSDIDEILLVGGATRTPLIVERLESTFARTPKAVIDPDLCVAMGAAIHAGALAGEKVASVLVDVTPYTFGTSIVGELDGRPHPRVFFPIIRKNTPLPVSRSEVFYTLEDGQAAVEVCVYQGEDRDAGNNLLIGTFTVEGLRRAPAPDPIVLRFDLDLNGILRVTATEKATGLAKQVRIDKAVPIVDQEALNRSRSRVAALFDEDGGESQCQRAGQLLVRAEKILEKIAAAEDRQELARLVQILQEALASRNEDRIKKAAETLEELLYYLES